MCAKAIAFGCPSVTTDFIALKPVLISPGARLDTWYRRRPGRSDIRHFHRETAWGSDGRGSQIAMASEPIPGLEVDLHLGHEFFHGRAPVTPRLGSVGLRELQADGTWLRLR